MAEGAESKLGLHTWSEQLQERTIHFQALRLEGQVIIWVGEEAVLGCLAMAVPVADCPSTQVIGSDDQSLQLSSRLAKKLSKQVLVSFNLEDDIMFTPMVVSRLMQEIKENPDKF